MTSGSSYGCSASTNCKFAMFAVKDGVTQDHLKDWGKYKAAMAEMEKARAGK